MPRVKYWIINYSNIFESREQIKKRLQLLLYSKLWGWLTGAISSRYTCMYVSIRKKKSKECLFKKHRSEKGNRLDKTPHSTYNTKWFVLKKRWTINWLKMSFLPMIFVISLQSTKEKCSCFYTVNRKDGLYGTISSRRLSIRKKESKEFLFKNRDLKKKVSGLTRSHILHTI